MSASVSCVVTSYNNGPWLKQCVESVLAQTRPVDEIVIADDASTDGSQDLIRSFAAQRPEIRPVLRETNLGVAANRDLAVREASGELITTLDGDDYYYPEKIEREVGAFADSGAAATVVFSDLDFVDPSGVVLKCVDFARLESLRSAALVEYLAFRAGPMPRDMLFPKSLFLEAGGFRHALKMYED
jgi:glycosyltransferase involved in cell wall biosynthesis